MRRFFFFMKDRDWEAEAEYIPVYVMRIAGQLCSKRLGEKRSRRAAGLCGKSRGMFNQVRVEGTRTIRERIELMKVFLRLTGHEGGHPSSV
jgi:hypothetical protein